MSLAAETAPPGEKFMKTFRTRRPLLVNATQCLHPTLILTDSGQRKAYPGDWIIEGENHERYIVDNTFFQRTFAGQAKPSQILQTLYLITGLPD